MQLDNFKLKRVSVLETVELLEKREERADQKTRAV
jgi:hypothetical protein